MSKKVLLNLKIVILIILCLEINIAAVIPNSIFLDGRENNRSAAVKLFQDNTHASTNPNVENKNRSSINIIEFNGGVFSQPNRKPVFLSNGNIRSSQGTLSQNSQRLEQKIEQKIESRLDSQRQRLFDKPLPLISAFNRDIDSKIIEYVKYIIDQNRQRIIQHNKCKKVPYVLGENKFIIYTQQQFKSIYLTLQQPGQGYVKNQPQNITVELPANFNKRLLQDITINWKTAKKVTSVKYQIDCGGCYSFTALGAIQSAYILKGRFLNLAEQQLIDCSSSFGNKGCVGGWTINAYKYIKQNGVLIESDYPFNGKTGNCSLPQNKTKFFIKQYVELKNDCNIVIEALKLQPLSIAVNALQWQYYSTGIFTDCQAGPSNHGVVLAGVDSESWLIKNSWGYSWGEQGYIRISRASPNYACNVCQWASYPII